jgi:hypothetical protein
VVDLEISSVLVAGVELVDGASIVLGAEHGHRASGEVAAVAGLSFAVGVGEDGSMSPARVSTGRGREPLRLVTRMLMRP